MDLAGTGGLVAAAGPAAVLVPQDDRAADGGGISALCPTSSGRDGPASRAPSSQVRRKPARPPGPDQVDGPADDRVPEHILPLRGRGPRPGRGLAAGRARGRACLTGRVLSRQVLSLRVRGMACGPAGSGPPAWSAALGEPAVGPGCPDRSASGRLGSAGRGGVRRHRPTRSSRAPGWIPPVTTGMTLVTRHRGAGGPPSHAAPSPPASEPAAGGRPPHGHLPDPLLRQHDRHLAPVSYHSSCSRLGGLRGPLAVELPGRTAGRGPGVGWSR